MAVRRASTGMVALMLMGGVASAQQVLTLHDAVMQALEHNERVADQHDTTAQAQLGVRLARNAFAPKIVPNISGSFGQTDINSQVYRVDVAQKFATGTELRVGVGTATAQIPALPGISARDIHFYNADSTISISQPLLRGFGSDVTRRALTSAEFRRADADRHRVQTEQQVTVDTASAYYRVVAQQSFVPVAKASLDRARQLRDASEAKLAAGLVSQLDVLRAQQLVSQAELQWLDARAAVEDARDTLLELMGREAGEAIEVDADIPTAIDAVDVDDAVATALTHRPDLQGLQAAVDDADRQLAYARNQLLPEVDANVAFTRRQTASTFGDSFGLDRFRLFTFLTVSMPIDRTPQLVDFENARIDRERRRRDADVARRRVVDDVKRALRERDRLSRTVAAADAAVDIGRREVDIARFRYERGISDNLDVVTAEANLLAAESRRVSAMADSAVTHLRVRAVVGVLDPRRDVGTLSDAAPLGEAVRR